MGGIYKGNLLGTATYVLRGNVYPGPSGSRWTHQDIIRV